MKEQETNEIIIFDESKYFNLDTQLLYINGCPAEKALTGKPFVILKYLAQNSPNLKSKDEIYERCWGLEEVIPDDTGVRNHINKIRKYIGDIEISKRKYKYIVTTDDKYKCICKITTVPTITEQDGKYLYFIDETDVSGAKTSENDNVSAEESVCSASTTLVSPEKYCNKYGIEGFFDSALSPDFMIENLRDKSEIYILATTGTNVIAALASDFIANALVNGTSFTILVPNKYSSFINDVADIETPYDKNLSRDSFASQFENIIKTIKREILKANHISSNNIKGSVYIGCAFTYLRQTVTLGVKNNKAWGYQSMTMPPSRTISGTSSFVFSGNINEETMAKRVFSHINAIIDEAKSRNAFFEITSETDPLTFNFGLEKLNAKKYWEERYKEAQNNMNLHMYFHDELIEVAAQHPLEDGKPSLEFRSRLDFAFELYKRLHNGSNVKIYIPGSVHSVDGIKEQCSLSMAGVKYLIELGVPEKDLLGDSYNYKYKGESGVYNSADECFVASKIFLDGKYKYIRVICSPNQIVRKQLFYLSFGVVPLFYTEPCNNQAHDLIYELFDAVPDVIYNDHDWQSDKSLNAIRTRNERKLD